MPAPGVRRCVCCETARSILPRSASTSPLRGAVIRLVFLGSPPVAARSLRTLHEAGHDIRCVVTQADRRRSRGGSLQGTAVKEVAAELGLPVTHRLADLLTIEADLGVVVAFGRIIPAAILAALPMVNLH